MIKYLLFFTVFVFSLCLISGCSSRPPSEDADLKFNFTIIMGQGGGFTGNYEGIYLDSAGTVFKWTGRTFNSSKKMFAKQLNKQEIYSIINLIDTSGVQNTKYEEHGNISSFIIIMTDKVENRISWNGLEPDSKVPRNIKNLYSVIRQMTN